MSQVPRRIVSRFTRQEENTIYQERIEDTLCGPGDWSNLLTVRSVDPFRMDIGMPMLVGGSVRVTVEYLDEPKS